MKFLIALNLLFVSFAYASGEKHRPISITLNSGKAVFVDFKTAHYTINYDLELRKSWVEGVIEFNQEEDGFPIFDSVQKPYAVVVDGISTTAGEMKTPGGETTVRYINRLLGKGVHTAKISVPLTSLVEYQKDGVKSAFWATDLEDRGFLERYLPANLEYDQVKMNLTVVFSEGLKKQKIYTNGEVKKAIRGKNHVYEISYPNYYTSSSIFFHTVPEGQTSELSFSLKSIDGRTIPVLIYAQKSYFPSAVGLEKLKINTTEVFHELEGDYGAWPHPFLIIYHAGQGGMEYCGATMTSAKALGHEMFHSYFARGVMPANGNSGWIDEALASWRDDGYQSLTNLWGQSGLSSHPRYTRKTDINAYSFGERFMSYLNSKLGNRGGLKPFLRTMVENKIFTTISIQEFIQEMNKFYGVNLEPDFKKYTFGDKLNFYKSSSSLKSHPIHKKMSLEELDNFL